MKQFLLCCLLIGGAVIAKAQTAEKPTLYNPNADAEKDVKAAIAQAAREKKHVLLQMGGNWCGWCIMFNKYVTTDPQLDSLVKANYVVYHLNYSPENKNTAQFVKYGYPQRFGFPVFVVLDSKGKQIHTQDSALLEEGKGYNRKKVVDFFTNWGPGALDPEKYKKM